MRRKGNPRKKGGKKMGGQLKNGELMDAVVGAKERGRRGN